MIYGNASHRRKIFSPWIYIGMLYDKLNLVIFYKSWIDGENRHNIIPCPFTIEDIRKELKGKNLSCFCPTNNPCHADVLLDIANS